MLSRSYALALVLAAALAASGCATPEWTPSPEYTLPPQPTPDPFPHGTREGDVALADLAAAHGLDVKIDLVTSRRILSNATNTVVVMPGTRTVAINGIDHALLGEVRWKDGKLYLPGDARVLFGENLRSQGVPELGSFAALHGTSAPAPSRPFAPGVTQLPASWNVAANRTWTYIVVHHSATPGGGARSFDRDHAKKWTHGLGYHFVIGNGTETRDGEIEVGSRWLHQNEGIHGAHAGVDKFNQHGIGICLVGDFERGHPTAAQMTALRDLCAHLMNRYGIAKSNILGHRSVKAGHTDCPGSRFPLEELLRGL